ncbi:hypothetical protein ACJ73_04772, partial [Blastomyces percursus]
MRVADFLNPSTPERSRTPEPAVPPDTTAEPSTAESSTESSTSAEPTTAESQDRPVLGEISGNVVSRERFHLTRDERHEILTLRDACFTYDQIVSHFWRMRRVKITHRQVQYACQQEYPTPKKRPGRPVKLTEEQVNEIIEFITASRENRRA